jgi:uncharacterized protein (TIGR03086 family)
MGPDRDSIDLLCGAGAQVVGSALRLTAGCRVVLYGSGVSTVSPERAICARVTETGDRYRRRADAFETLITHTAPERWTSPSPCEGWLARDVVAHVVDYSGQVLRERAGMSEVSVFADFDDPAPAFAAIREVVEQVLDDPETPPDMANYLDLAVSFDLPQHGWDLAKATGQDPAMDPEEVELLWGSLLRAPQVWDWQRENGWYGTPVSVPSNAPLQDRVLGLIGRDPGWTPET